MNKDKVFFKVEPYYEVEYNKSTGDCIITSYAFGKKMILKQRISHDGYLVTKINSLTLPIHRLIRDFFFSKKKGYTVNHIDGNKLNNSLNNLEYVTIAENVKHAVRLGLHPSSDPKRSGRYKDGRAIKSRIKIYKREWYLRKKHAKIS